MRTILIPALLELTPRSQTSESALETSLDVLAGMNYRAFELGATVSTYSIQDIDPTPEQGDLENAFVELLEKLSREPTVEGKPHFVVVNTRYNVDVFKSLARACYKSPHVKVVIGANTNADFAAWTEVNEQYKRIGDFASGKLLQPVLISPASNADFDTALQNQRTFNVLSVRMTVPLRFWAVQLRNYLQVLRRPELSFQICIMYADTPEGRAYQSAVQSVYASFNEESLLRFVSYNPQSLASMEAATREAFTGPENAFGLYGGTEIFQFILPKKKENTALVVSGFLYSLLALLYETLEVKQPESLALRNHYQAYIGVALTNNSRLSSLQQRLESQWGLKTTPDVFLGYDSLSLAIDMYNTITRKLTDPQLGSSIFTIVRETCLSFSGALGDMFVDQFFDRSTGTLAAGLPLSIGEREGEDLFSPAYIDSMWGELALQNIQRDTTISTQIPFGVKLDIALKPLSTTIDVTAQGQLILSPIGGLQKFIFTNTFAQRAVSDSVIPPDFLSDKLAFKGIFPSSITSRVTTREAFVGVDDSLSTPGLNYAAPSVISTGGRAQDTAPKSRVSVSLPAYVYPIELTNAAQKEIDEVISVTILVPRFQANSQALAWEYAYVSDAFGLNPLTVAFKSVLCIVDYNALVSYYGIDPSTPSLVPALERFVESARLFYRKSRLLNFICDSEACFTAMQSRVVRKLMDDNLARMTFINPPAEWPRSPPPPPPQPQAYMDQLAQNLYDRCRRWDRISFGTKFNFGTLSMISTVNNSYRNLSGAASLSGQLLRLKQLSNAGAEYIAVDNLSALYGSQTPYLEAALEEVRPSDTPANRAYIPLNFNASTLVWDPVIYYEFCWGSLFKFTVTDVPQGFAVQTAMQFARSAILLYVVTPARYGTVAPSYLDLTPSSPEGGEAEVKPGALLSTVGDAQAYDVTRGLFLQGTQLSVRDTFTTPRAPSTSTFFLASIANEIAQEPNVFLPVIPPSSPVPPVYGLETLQASAEVPAQRVLIVIRTAS